MPFKVAEVFFEYVGNALRQPADYLEKFVRDSLKTMEKEPTPVSISEFFIKSASRHKAYPVEDVGYHAQIDFIIIWVQLSISPVCSESFTLFLDCPRIHHTL